MISDNQKISQRQFGCLIILDWIGKALLLLPRFAAGASGRSFILSLLGGILLAILYARMVGKISCHMEHGFYAYIGERLGQGCAHLLTWIYLCYAFVNTLFLVWMFAQIAVTFILPEASRELLMAAVLIGSVYIISGGLEVRARVGEVLFRVVIYPLLFLLICAAFSMEPEYLAPGRAAFSLQTAKHGMQTFIAFGGMGIFLYVVPYLNRKEKMGQTLLRAAGVTGAGVCALFIAAIGAFGESGIRALPWPAVTLMSSAEIPGGFLQRWDVIFTALLLATFFPAVSAGLFYMKHLSEEMFGREYRAGKFVPALLVFAGALWCGSFETARRVFTVVNGCLCVPVAVGFTVILLLVERAKGRRKKGILWLAALCLLLTGCGRRELEDREFPTVLTAESGNIRRQQEERQAKSSKYIDYGHVKAVILSEEAARDGESLREILTWLEEDPAFARNILIYVGSAKTLELAEKKEDETGMYLEDLSKNQPGDLLRELPLKDLLNYLHNGEASVRIPKLREEDGEIVPDGTVELTQEAAAAVHVPVPRGTG